MVVMTAVATKTRETMKTQSMTKIQLTTEIPLTTVILLMMASQPMALTQIRVGHLMIPTLQAVFLTRLLSVRSNKHRVMEKKGLRLK